MGTICGTQHRSLNVPRCPKLTNGGGASVTERHSSHAGQRSWVVKNPGRGPTTHTASPVGHSGRTRHLCNLAPPACPAAGDSLVALQELGAAETYIPLAQVGAARSVRALTACAHLPALEAVKTLGWDGRVGWGRLMGGWWVVVVVKGGGRGAGAASAALLLATSATTECTAQQPYPTTTPSPHCTPPGSCTHLAGVCPCDTRAKGGGGQDTAVGGPARSHVWRRHQRRGSAQGCGGYEGGAGAVGQDCAELCAEGRIHRQRLPNCCIPSCCIHHACASSTDGECRLPAALPLQARTWAWRCCRPQTRTSSRQRRTARAARAARAGPSQMAATQRAVLALALPRRPTVWPARAAWRAARWSCQRLGRLPTRWLRPRTVPARQCWRRCARVGSEVRALCLTVAAIHGPVLRRPAALA